jgi:hypothetical protein
MADYVLGTQYRAQRRLVTAGLKANAHLFPFNFEISKEEQRERVRQQVNTNVQCSRQMTKMILTLIFTTTVAVARF